MRRSAPHSLPPGIKRKEKRMEGVTNYSQKGGGEEKEAKESPDKNFLEEGHKKEGEDSSSSFFPPFPSLESSSA